MSLREQTVAEKIREQRALRDSRNAEAQSKVTEPEVDYHNIENDRRAKSAVSNSPVNSINKENADNKLVKDCSRSDIAELMRTLKETREQASRTSNRLADNRAKATSEQIVAETERKTFIKEQEARDKVSLKSQQQSQGHGSPDKDDFSIPGSSTNQLHEGLVVVQGRRDLISQLRQASTQSIQEEDEYDDVSGGGGVICTESAHRNKESRSKHEDKSCEIERADSSLRCVERIRKEQNQDKDILDYSLLVGCLGNDNPEKESLNSNDSAYAQRIASASAARGIASVLKEVANTAVVVEESGGMGGGSDSTEDFTEDFRASHKVIRDDWDRRIKENGGIYVPEEIKSESSSVVEGGGLVCSTCGRVFKKEMHLRLHSNVHQRTIEPEKKASPKPSSPSRNLIFECKEDGAKGDDMYDVELPFQVSEEKPVDQRQTSDETYKLSKNEEDKISNLQISTDTASCLREEKKGPDMDAMHRLWEVLQSPEEGMDTGIINQVLGGNSTETKLIDASRGVVQTRQMPTSSTEEGGESSEQMEERKQQFEAAQAARQAAEADEVAARAKKKLVSDSLVELDSQSAKLEAMMEAMGAAGTKDLSTLSGENILMSSFLHTYISLSLACVLI